MLCGLIERIVLHPAESEESGFLIDIEADPAGILSLRRTSEETTGLMSDDLMRMKLVAGARNSRFPAVREEHGAAACGVTSNQFRGC